MQQMYVYSSAIYSSAKNLIIALTLWEEMGNTYHAVRREVLQTNSYLRNLNAFYAVNSGAGQDSPPKTTTIFKKKSLILKAIYLLVVENFEGAQACYDCAAALQSGIHLSQDQRLMIDNARTLRPTCQVTLTEYTACKLWLFLSY